MCKVILVLRQDHIVVFILRIKVCFLDIFCILPNFLIKSESSAAAVQM